MSGRTNQIASALAADCAAVTGVRTAAATPTDSVPGTPYMYVGPPKGTQVPGMWEQREYHFPLHYLIARTGSEDRDQVAINDALDLVLDAFRTGITCGGLAVSALIVAFDTDQFATVAGEDYQAILFDVWVTVMQAGGYTA